MSKRSGICILLGAGANCDAGLPTSNGLLREFVTYLKADKENGTLYYLRSGKPWWPAPSHPDIQGTINVIDKLRPTDIEDLMRKLKARIPAKSFTDEEREYRDIYDSARFFIYWRLRTPSIEDISYFGGFFDLLSFTNGSPLVIATLNWDCSVERALGWRNISTGFESSYQKIWTDGTFQPDRKFWLIKLHGSLSWVDYSWRTSEPGLPTDQIYFDPITEETGKRFNKVAEVSLWTHEAAWERAIGNFGKMIRSPIPWPRVIIFGPQKEKEYGLSLAMFPKLRSRFVETLMTKKILISIGFSWRDRWVCKVIRDAKKTGLRVIDIKPSGQRKGVWTQSSGDIRIPCGTRTALEAAKTVILPFLRK